MSDQPEIITQAEAKARGLKRYFTGERCQKGHISERQVSTRNCCKCANLRERTERYRKKKEAAARMRRAKNPDKYRDKSRLSYRKNAEKKAAYSRKYRLLHPEVIKRKNENVKSYRLKITDLLAVLRAEKPELLKEFGL